MTSDHPVFGNFEPRNATQALVTARDTGKSISLDDVTPTWAKDARMSTICAIGGAGPTSKYDKRHLSYADFIEQDWNNSQSTRNPAVYFQGAFESDVQKDGTVLYKFVGQKRHHKKAPYWDVE